MHKVKASLVSAQSSYSPGSPLDCTRRIEIEPTLYDIVRGGLIWTTSYVVIIGLG